MSLSATLHKHLERVLHTPIQKVQPVTGGDINQAYRLDTSSAIFFIKTNTHTQAMLMFEAEAYALQKMGEHLKTPTVHGHGIIENQAFLLLEWIERGWASQQFWEHFGRQLASMHRQTHPMFGWQSDNFIATLPQSNQHHTSWTDFYIQERLRPQLKMATDTGLLNRTDLDHAQRLYQCLPDICPNEPPALTHGDLWSGNFIPDTSENVVLIDPAAAYAHREMDLAMSRLFGGFDARFYQAYIEAYPLVGNLEDRLEVYQLYYLLVHVNLFGGGYVPSVRQILKRY